MILGCFQSNRGLRSLQYETFVAEAAALGYKAFDVPPLDDAAVTVARQHGRIHATSAVVPPDLSADSGRQETIIQEVTKAVDWAASHGIPVITHLIGCDMSRSGDENIALFKDVYTPIAAHAEAKGVKLAFENWPRNGTMLAITPELWDAMFTAVPSPSLGLCYDPSHLLWLGIEPIQPVYDFADRIVHAHAKDTEFVPAGRNRFGIYGRRLQATQPAEWWRYRLPGYGQVDWHAYLDALYRVGYDDVLSVEHEDPEWEQSGPRALRGLALAERFLTPMLV